jgi:hypothetical protein
MGGKGPWGGGPRERGAWRATRARARRRGTAARRRSHVGVPARGSEHGTTVVPQHAYLTPYRTERVVKGPKHSYIIPERTLPTLVPMVETEPLGLGACGQGAPAKPLLSYDSHRIPLNDARGQTRVCRRPSALVYKQTHSKQPLRPLSASRGAPPFLR